MLRPGSTVLQQVGDPAGSIDEHGRDDRLAARFLERPDNGVQTLRRKLVLASAPLGDGSRRFGRSSALWITLQLGGDGVGFEGEAIALGAGGEKRREDDARLAALDGDADDHSASFERTQSEAHGGRSLPPVRAHAGVAAGAMPSSGTQAGFVRATRIESRHSPPM
jgi:hypothetical protein